MMTRMNMVVTINGNIDSASLYEDLKDYHVNVSDIISKTYVYGVVDLIDPCVENIIQICHKYGDCEVKLKPSDY